MKENEVKFNEPLVKEHESCYVIALVMRGKRPVKMPDGKLIMEGYDIHLFFKADRYSPYSGRLQAETTVVGAKKWLTPDGAQKALKRLLEKCVIKAHHRPCVCKYTRFVTERYDVVTSDTPENYESLRKGQPPVAQSP